MAELTKTAIEKLAVPEGKFDTYLWDPSLPSFGVRKIGSSGSMSFVVKFTIGGKQRKQSLAKLIITGSTTKDDVARVIRTARNEAQNALARARLNDDFRADSRAKAAEDAAQTKLDAAERARLADQVGPRIETYIVERRRDLRPRSWTETHRHLTKHLRPIHALPVTDLRRDIIAAEITRIAKESGAVAADRVRASLSAFCGWMIERQIIEANPCTGIKRKANGGGRDRVLSMEELTAVWAATDSDFDHDRIVRLLMLTGQRREEIGGLEWSEVDFARREIQLPATRTKNNKAHVIPLSDQALEILHAVSMRHGRQHLFGTGKGPFSGWSKSKQRLDDRLAGRVAPWTLHDLRRSFASHCADLDFGSVLAIEAGLNHLSGERAGIKGIYNRGKQEKQKRELMEKWGGHIAPAPAAAAAPPEPPMPLIVSETAKQVVGRTFMRELLNRGKRRGRR
jgi:integrase